MPMNKARRGRNRSVQRHKGDGVLYAAVDLGTNNCRLLVAERRGQYFRVVESYSQIARLGEGLTETGNLSDAAIERAIDALKAIRSRLKRRGVGHIRCIATEACRKAGNGKDFVRRVQDEVGLSFKIIGGREEARLAALGCHDLIRRSRGLIMVLDIGGGSTEISFVDAHGISKAALPKMVQNLPIKTWRSFPIGVVTLHDKFTHLAGASDEGFAEMRAHARSLFQTWQAGVAFCGAITEPGAHIIGTSGTVTCLAGVHLKLPKYNRHRVDGSWMSRDEGDSIIRKMIEAGPEGRAAFPTIGPERASLMVPGCAILSAAWDVWPAETMRIADRGLREGILLSMMHGPRKARRRRGNGQARKPPAENSGASA